MKKLSLLTVLFMLARTCIFAQAFDPKKLESVQKESVFAPSPVKIDGKLNEWNNNFKAYNRNTRLLYILSNDEKNMYLVVKSTDFTTKAKIIAGGVDLIVNTEGKKKDKDAPSVTFPVIEHPERLGGNISERFENRNAGVDTELMNQLHQRTIIAAKQIRVLNIKPITDTLISIYNTDGIKTALNFDTDGGLTLEMSIPLKYFNLTPESTKEMAYHIVLNGFQPEWGGGPSGPGGNGGPNTLNMFDLMTPSDFWGKYSLAKK
ncbi:hypothetical protein ACFS5N_10175 [Mucilaginibacter ximonensis]|uniref:Uncharacterized protein n=2 Tax=Mucilaginibacter ximonensis TaxID=538021 RepID=A0ABW5YC20_9SPHI